MTFIVKTDREEIYLVPMGDMHVGHKNFMKERFERDLQWCIDNKNVYVIGMGDYMELSARDSPGVFDQDSFANKQYETVYNYFKPLADEKRLLGLLMGNHEYRITKYSGFDITKILANNLGVEYFEHAAFFKLKVNDIEYTVFGQHGYTSSRTDGGKLNVVIKLANQAIADIYMVGHSHDVIAKPKPIYRLNGERELHDRIFVMSGSYLEHWGSYGQMKGYDPSLIGSPRIKLHTNEYNITVKV